MVELDRLLYEDHGRQQLYQRALAFSALERSWIRLVPFRFRLRLCARRLLDPKCFQISAWDASTYAAHRSTRAERRHLDRPVGSWRIRLDLSESQRLACSQRQGRTDSSDHG